MVHIHRFRPEDYWLLVVSFFSILFIGMTFYVGTMQLRLLCAVPGFGLLFFVSYIIRRGYSKRRAEFHVIVCFILGAAFALGVHLLTN